MSALAPEVSAAPAPPTQLEGVRTQIEKLESLLLLATQASEARQSSQIAALTDLALDSFTLAIENRDWKRALKAVPYIDAATLQTPAMIATIFLRDVTSQKGNVAEARLAVWATILRQDLMTPNQLIVNRDQNGKSALMNVVEHGTPDMQAWAITKTSPQDFKADFTRKLGHDKLDYVAWMAARSNDFGLKILFQLKTSDGELVFPRTRGSSWAWSSFYPQVKKEYCSDQASGFFRSLQFWFVSVAPEMAAIQA